MFEPYLLRGLVAASVAAGLGWATVLRRYRPGTYARIGHATVDAPMPDVLAAPAPAERPRRWARHRNGVTQIERWAALRTIRRLGPLWREIHAAVPEVALLPRYRGPAALRSTARHAPLQAIRMQVEILDGYAALAPWMTAQVRTVAQRQARRHRLTGPEKDAAVEAAVLAAAIRARGRGLAPAAADQPILSPPDATLTRLVQVGHALRRCPVVPATLRELGVADPAPSTA